MGPGEGIYRIGSISNPLSHNTILHQAARKAAHSIRLPRAPRRGTTPCRPSSPATFCRRHGCFIGNPHILRREPSSDRPTDALKPSQARGKTSSAGSTLSDSCPSSFVRARLGERLVVGRALRSRILPESPVRYRLPLHSARRRSPSSPPPSRRRSSLLLPPLLLNSPRLVGLLRASWELPFQSPLLPPCCAPCRPAGDTIPRRCRYRRAQSPS